MKKKGKFVEPVLSSSKKVPTSKVSNLSMTYNQARLEGVYRTPSRVAASYQPKAMLSTPLNNRRYDKKVVSVNRNSGTNYKKNVNLSTFNASASNKKPGSYMLIQKKYTLSEDKQSEDAKTDEGAQKQSPD